MYSIIDDKEASRHGKIPGKSFQRNSLYFISQRYNRRICVTHKRSETFQHVGSHTRTSLLNFYQTELHTTCWNHGLKLMNHCVIIATLSGKRLSPQFIQPGYKFNKRF